jgi:hypothetical protein
VNPRPPKDEGNAFYPSFLEEDPFLFIKDYESFGIRPSDIPLGTLPALRHPSSQIPSRGGGSSYGCGLFEMCHLLSPEDLKFLQGISLESPEDLRSHYARINEICGRLGLLIRFSSLGKRYYLIPVHLVSNTLTHIRAKVEEISKIVSFHKKKYTKEDLVIGAVTQEDDLITQDLAIRFKEHRFIPIESLADLKRLHEELDMVILTSDPFELAGMVRFGQDKTLSALSRRQSEHYAMYLLWKLYGVIKPGGEIFLIAHHHLPRTEETTLVEFLSEREEKSFLLFSHIFKTHIPYKSSSGAMKVNVHDLQNYLRGRYVEQDVIDSLLKGKEPERLSLTDYDSLPHKDYPLNAPSVPADQAAAWNKIFSTFFSRIFLKPYVFGPVKREWESRLDLKGFSPRYMLTYLGQKRAVKKTVSEIKRDVLGSGIAGCPIEFVADYRDSFDYVIRTLRVVERIRKGAEAGVPEIYLDRLTEPLENKKRRYYALNDVIRLSRKTGKLESVERILNPEGIEGKRTSILEHIEALSLFGLTQGETRELILIVLGHSAMGRIICGKMTEKALKGLSDLAARLSPQQALNLLRYCRLLTMAEMEASRGSPLTGEQITELFKLYDAITRVTVNMDLDWNTFLDDEIAAQGGIRNKVIRQLLKMIGHFEFLDNWHELGSKGPTEKQALADFDQGKLSRLENAIRLVSAVERFEKGFLEEATLRAPAFYRKILSTEFHGTGHIFERMDGALVWVLIWIAVNVSRGEVINFNPMAPETDAALLSEKIKELEYEVRAIKLDHMDTLTLNNLADQVYRHGQSFIAGTGFKLCINPKSRALEISHTDIAKGIRRLDAALGEIYATKPAYIPSDRLAEIESVFSDLEDFYQSHLRLIGQKDRPESLPSTQLRWFERIEVLRKRLAEALLKNLFLPNIVHDNLKQLSDNAPSLARFLFPELADSFPVSSADATASEARVETRNPLQALKKLQAITLHKREGFQDARLMHRLAHKEFGPLATGIVGVSDEQLLEIEAIADRLASKGHLLDALVKSLVLMDIGRLPWILERYGGMLNQAEPGEAAAKAVEITAIAERYNSRGEARKLLLFLLKNQGILLHIIRGEYAFSSISQLLETGSKDLFDAVFLESVVIMSAYREDLFLEDMAGMLFYIRRLCHRIIDGETDLAKEMERVYEKRGRIFNLLEMLRGQGLPEGVSSIEKISMDQTEVASQEGVIQSGRMIYGFERFLRLQGIRYIRFADLADSILRVPHKAIYMKRAFASVGMATFERELYDSKSIYQTLQGLDEPARHFLLEELTGDRLRIVGLERVSGYLTYENRIKLVLMALLAARQCAPETSGLYLDFHPLERIISRRFEALNRFLGASTPAEIMRRRSSIRKAAKRGIIFSYHESSNVISVAFQDQLRIPEKIARMEAIDDVEKLKQYFHSSLKALRRYPFNTEDYEHELEKAFERRIKSITDKLMKTGLRQMEQAGDFRELNVIYQYLSDRAWEIGFSEEQLHRLNDAYQLRKEVLKRQKLSEVATVLSSIGSIDELEEYWEKVKGYLKANSPYSGKELDIIVARRFDQARYVLERQKIP